MKQFLTNLLLFLLAFSVIYTILITGILFITSSAGFTIPPEKNIIVIGDSCTACAIDDSIFTSAFNISEGGSAYIYAYVKLRKFIQENPHVDTVIVSFHGDSIHRQMDDYVTGARYMMNYMPSYFSLFHKEEIVLFARNTNFLPAFLRIPIRSILIFKNFITGQERTYRDLQIGGYDRLEYHKLDDDIAIKKTIPFEYSQYQLQYLQKIADLSRRYGFELILFSTPIYNPEIYGNRTALLDFYNNYFQDVRFIDYSDFSLPRNGYADTIHLNYRGAQIFSQYLQDNHESIFLTEQVSR